jgi:hypothetical protein
MKIKFSIFITILTTKLFGQDEKMINLKDFLPNGYVVLEQIIGDLNKDGNDDYILLIKGKDTNKIVEDEYRGKLDLNRRGIIVLLNKNKKYELILKNIECFSSGNEDGGVYSAPELSIEIKKGNLYIHYGHGRYGYWRYTFRLNKLDFELIQYEVVYSNGSVINKVVSINFLNRTKLEKENINENADYSGKEIFKTTYKKIKVDKLLKLSEIKDFDSLDLSIN